MQEYTFTLTQGDGTRVQGFCRRFLPPAPRVGSKLRYPQVLCLVCEASWPMVFFKASACGECLVAGIIASDQCAAATAPTLLFHLHDTAQPTAAACNIPHTRLVPVKTQQLWQQTAVLAEDAWLVQESSGFHD